MQFEASVSDVAGITLRLRSYSQVIHAANVRLPWDIGLSTFEDCKNLSILNLENTKLSDVGLANFVNCEGMWRLYLRGTQVTDSGLANFTMCKELFGLYLDNTIIGDKAVLYMKSWPNLSELHLRQTKVTSGGIVEINQLIPRCKIEADGAIGKPNDSLPPTFTNTLGMEFVIVPKGKSWLGGSKDKLGDKEVEIKEDFYLGKYEVTKQEWVKVMGENPSHFSRMGDGKEIVKDISDADLQRFPVEMVSWDQCQVFIAKLNMLEKEKAWVYRLPSELEWEYACRGGPMEYRANSAFEYYFALPTNTLQMDMANFDKVLNRTCKVGSYRPNLLGLFDMHGNVFEWCDDTVAATNGATQRVDRGGGWDMDAGYCKAANQGFPPPTFRCNHLGLRLVRVPTSDLSHDFSKLRSSPDLGRAYDALAPGIKTGSPPTFKNSIGMEFVKVPKGTAWLGGGSGQPGNKKVEIEQDFFLGKYEVTQEEWEAVTGLAPSHFSRTGQGADAVKDISDAELKRFPVEQVSRDDCQLFIERLNLKEKDTGLVYRLPKEAEWEYACRGGPADKLYSSFDFYFSEPTNTLLPNQANFEFPKALKRTTKVGSYEPNVLGLHDMHGNVWEWCEDAEKNDGEGIGYVTRGGGFYVYDVADCRADCRKKDEASFRASNRGLRVALIPSGVSEPGEQVKAK